MSVYLLGTANMTIMQGNINAAYTRNAHLQPTLFRKAADIEYPLTIPIGAAINKYVSHLLFCYSFP